MEGETEFKLCKCDSTPVLKTRSFQLYHLQIHLIASIISPRETHIRLQQYQEVLFCAHIRGGAKNAYVRIRSWHKSMSGSHVRISCQDLMSGSDVHFSVGFPVFTVKYFSIFGNLYLSLPFSVRFPVFAAKHFSKLEFCIYQCFSGLDFLMNFLIWFVNIYPLMDLVVTTTMTAYALHYD